MASDLLKGKKMYEIAKEHNLSTTQVSRILGPVKKRAMSEIDKAIYSDYMSKMSVKEIAEKYKINVGTVKYRIAREHANRLL
jgi:Mor family transcriptional regulator